MRKIISARTIYGGRDIRNIVLISFIRERSNLVTFERMTKCLCNFQDFVPEEQTKWSEMKRAGQFLSFFTRITLLSWTATEEETGSWDWFSAAVLWQSSSRQGSFNELCWKEVRSMPIRSGSGCWRSLWETFQSGDREKPTEMLTILLIGAALEYGESYNWSEILNFMGCKLTEPGWKINGHWEQTGLCLGPCQRPFGTVQKESRIFPKTKGVKLFHRIKNLNLEAWELLSWLVSISGLQISQWLLFIQTRTSSSVREP